MKKSEEVGDLEGYEIYSLAEFNESFKKKIAESGHKERVIRAIKDLARAPYKNTLLLKGPTLKGKRRVRIGKIRIIFAICEECRREGYTQFNRCKNCEEHPDKSIILWDIGFRGGIYD